MRALAVIESLELRRLLSVAIDPQNPSHLLVDGTGGDDFIEVDVSGTILTVTVNGIAEPFTLSAINAILIDAGAGNDTVTVDADVNKPCRIDGGAGNDSLTGGNARDSLIGGDGADTLDGGGGRNSIQSDPADTVVHTHVIGSTVFVEGTDNPDVILIHKVVGDPSGFVVSVNDDAQNMSLPSPFSVIDVASHDGNDSIIVDADVAINTILDGGEGADTIIGGAGNDTLSSRQDTPSGIADDTIIGTDGHDQFDGGAGQDTIFGSTGDDTITGGVGNDCIRGGDGDDLIFGSDGNDSIDGSLGDDTIHGEDGDDNLRGGDGDDDLHGDDGNDTLRGGAGHDTLNGDSGRDMLFPDGVDLLRGDPQDSGVDVTNGVMRIIGSIGDDSILINFEDTDASNLVTVIVNGEDVFYPLGNVSFIQIDGGGGNDTIEVRNLNVKTTLNGGAGNDIIRGSLGPDRLNGGDGSDWLNGGDNKDTLYGDAGNDKLFGGAGKDYLNGGAGVNVVRGGAGIDRIVATRLVDDVRGNREDVITLVIY